MKMRWAIAVVGLGLVGTLAPALAQPWSGPGYGYRDRDDDDYRDRRRHRNREYGFDEREYLRCNPDVLRAVRRGQMESGFAHYRTFGRREGRRLSC